MTDKQFDLIAIGRVSMDLFAENIGAPFEDITDFVTSVGGSPSNIAIGTSKLGLRVALLTAVGEDEVGHYVLRYLRDERVETAYIPRKPGTRTPLAVVGIQPPSTFPLVFYRENPADIHLTIDDVQATPIAASRALLLSGTALSRGTCRDATLYAAEVARSREVTTFIDLDLRPDQWSHARAYGVNVRTLLPRTDVVIGTEEEFYAALSPTPGSIMQGEAVDDTRRMELEVLLKPLLWQGARALIVKRGARGVTIYTTDDTLDVAGFPVEILNTVGAGDAFASGLIYGYLQGWDWHRTARMANACGAIVVTRHGCSAAMPHLQEALDFIESKGGF